MQFVLRLPYNLMKPEKTFKVIVSGTRSFSDYHLLRDKLDDFFQNKKDIELVVKAKGPVEVVVSQYAMDKGLNVKYFKLSKKDSKANKKKREKDMVEYADAIIVFWNGKSQGTKRILDFADKKGIPTAVVRYDSIKLKAS